MAELLTRMCNILKFSFIRGAFQPHLQELDLEAPALPCSQPLVLEPCLHYPSLTTRGTILLGFQAFSR